MKLSVVEDNKQAELEVIIRCREVDDEVIDIMQKLKPGQKSVTAYEEDEIHKILLKDIFYFETVENRSYIYCSDKVYQTKMKLYEFEELTYGTSFFRASKSVVLNADRIAFVKAGFSGRFEANLDNIEKVIVSRQYVPDLKKKIGL